MEKISTDDVHRIYQILTGSGIRDITKSFARLYIMNLLFHEEQGLTSTMIYCSLQKDLTERDIPEELGRSRSNIIDHLSELESEGLVQKGIFKQYILTDKGKKAHGAIMQLVGSLSPEQASI